MKYFIALFLCLWICVPVFCQSDSTGIKFDIKMRKEAANFMNTIIATEEKNTIKGGANMLIPYLKKTQADLQQEMKAKTEAK